MILISLVGEQPIPILLPVRRLAPEENLLVYTSQSAPVARRLRRLISTVDDLRSDLQIEPHDLPGALAALQRCLAGTTSELVFNLTGGTKPMFLAAYTLAQRLGCPFVYLDSARGVSRLQRFSFEDRLPVLQGSEILPALISIEDYLHAHVDSFKLEGFHQAAPGRLSEGGLFERSVCFALESRLDQVLAGVRPSGAAGQIEIDLLLRLGNQVGVAEVKLSGNRDLSKRGLDQLKMAAEPAYLGTYTAQFLIVGAGHLSPSVAGLANERRISVLYLPEYEDGRPLPAPAAARLADEIRRRLQPPRRP